MSKNIKFRLAAWSEAAGKYNPEAPLEGNEDNFYVDDDLQDDILSHFKKDEIVEMSDCGCLLAVADGMGGMNAGEVASDIAIATVKDYFNPLDPDTAQKIREYAPDAAKRKQYLETLIKDADKRLKNYAAQNQECRGMGSTIILAWIVGDKMTVSWCGDSRAYRYNPKQGITPLSKDHSLVQELVDRGVLTYEETFDHPQGNIVTRSLGDPSSPARPETKQYDVYNDDIILVCSDGLSGVLRDKETLDENGNVIPGQNIEAIIEQNTDSMEACRIALFQAAEQANWYDNVTVLLCQIISGAGAAPTIKREKAQLRPENEPYTGPITNPAVDIHKEEKNPFKKYYLIGGVVLLLILSFVGGALLFSKGEPTEEEITQAINRGDTIVFDESEGVTKIVTKEEKKEIEKKNKEIKEKKKKEEKKKGEEPNNKSGEKPTDRNEGPEAPDGGELTKAKVFDQGEIKLSGNTDGTETSPKTEVKTEKLTGWKKEQVEALNKAKQAFPKLAGLIDKQIEGVKTADNQQQYGTIVQNWGNRVRAKEKLLKLKARASAFENTKKEYDAILNVLETSEKFEEADRKEITNRINNLEDAISNAEKEAEKAEKTIKKTGELDKINPISEPEVNDGIEQLPEGE